MTTLKRGDKGAEVEELQQWLASLGFDPGGIDGDFGDGTEDALQAAQAAYNLEITGVYDPSEWADVDFAASPDTDTCLDGGPTAEQLADLCLAQVNTVYSNDNLAADDQDPDHFDCSELLKWSCAQLGVDPPFPDWSTAQIEHCEKDFSRSVGQARSIRGAVLYYENPGEGMDHIALSLGDGVYMVDANGAFDKVSVREIDDVPFSRAGLVPGIVYPAGS